MATEHGGNTALTRGADLLETVVVGVQRRLGGVPGVEASATRPATGGSDDRRDDLENDGAPERLLTPEEHILDVLEQSGGATRQSEIVASIEWSESTVSRKLSDLESRGAVSRYQIGREKLVCLPGHEPAAVESPLAAAD